jgi:XTP/dITP diphosphohydrolase
MPRKLKPRKIKEAKLVVASHNPGKVREIAALLAPYKVEVISAGALGLAEPEETGETFIANAELKALAAAKASGLVALADDSGLAVDGLGGEPGVYSARWGGPAKDFGLAMRKVHEALSAKNATDTSAHFACALSLAWPDGHVESFEGRVDGEIIWPPRGTEGFGYDPIFVAKGYDITFGEMAPEGKHLISHRAAAFRKLIDACFE